MFSASKSATQMVNLASFFMYLILALDYYFKQEYKQIDVTN